MRKTLAAEDPGGRGSGAGGDGCGGEARHLRLFLRHEDEPRAEQEGRGGARGRCREQSIGSRGAGGPGEPGRGGALSHSPRKDRNAGKRQPSRRWGPGTQKQEQEAPARSVRWSRRGVFPAWDLSLLGAATRTEHVRHARTTLGVRAVAARLAERTRTLAQVVGMGRAGHETKPGPTPEPGPAPRFCPVMEPGFSKQTGIATGAGVAGTVPVLSASGPDQPRTASQTPPMPPPCSHGDRASFKT